MRDSNRTNYNKIEIPVKGEAKVVEDVKEEPIIEKGGVKEEPKPSISDQVEVVNCEMLNVRSDASAESKVVSVVVKGSKLNVTGPAVNGFIPVKLGTGVEGYVMRQYVK